MNRELTDRQAEVLTFIAGFIEREGYSPTFREVGDYFNITIKSAFDHIRALRRKGAISYKEKCPRTIRITGGRI